MPVSLCLYVDNSYVVEEFLNPSTNRPCPLALCLYGVQAGSERHDFNLNEQAGILKIQRVGIRAALREEL